MKRLLVSLIGMLAWIASATAQPMIPGVGSPMIPNATSGSGGSFPPAGCSTSKGVIFNNATPCDSGFTYAGSGGQVSINGAALGATTGLLVNPASASGLVADFQVGGTSRANIDAVTGAYAISSDTFINRDAAGIFGLSNGAKDTGTVTLPASQRIYNTANGGLSGGNVVNAALMEMGFAQHSGIAAIDVYKNGTGTLPNFGIYIGGTRLIDYGVNSGGNITINSIGNGVVILQYNNGNGAVLQFGTQAKMQSSVDGTIEFTNSTGATGAFVSFPTATATPTFQFGSANVNGAPVAQTLSFQGALAGSVTNQASANTTFIGSLGTGTGTNGNMIFQVGVKTSTGTAQATATTALTLTGETLVASFAGSITAVLANAATTSAVCYNTGTGVLTYDGTVGTCTVSGRQFKNIIGDHDDFGPLRPATYRYKPESGFDDGRIHFGLIAQDVARMDDRCAVRNPVGEIINYEDRCVIAHLVADNDNLRAEIETLRMSIVR